MFIFNLTTLNGKRHTLFHPQHNTPQPTTLHHTPTALNTFNHIIPRTNNHNTHSHDNTSQLLILNIYHLKTSLYTTTKHTDTHISLHFTSQAKQQNFILTFKPLTWCPCIIATLIPILDSCRSSVAPVTSNRSAQYCASSFRACPITRGGAPWRARK